MILLQIEHPVQDFNSWKRVFDSDPANRKASRVRSYRIFKKIDDANYVIVDLEFDNIKDAEAMHESLKKFWGRVEGTVIMKPTARIVESVEIFEY